jgi:single-strand DNA-binding protein
MVMLLGNLGADPELTQTAGGPLLRMRLATTEVYFDKEKKRQERTEWHTVKTWGKRAEGLSKILSKGTRVCVKGRLETSSYDKEGHKHYRTDIVANDIFLHGGGGGNGMMRRAPEAPSSSGLADLPF